MAKKNDSELSPVEDFQRTLNSPVSFYLIRVTFNDLFSEVFSSRFQILKMIETVVREKGFKTPSEAMAYFDKTKLKDAPSAFAPVREALEAKIEQLVEAQIKADAEAFVGGIVNDALKS